MNNFQRIQGRLLRPEDIEHIRELLHDNPGWHRTRLSRELCQEWNWIDATGRLKNMACRTPLLKLHRRGSITLPPRPRYPPRRPNRITASPSNAGIFSFFKVHTVAGPRSRCP